MIYLLIRLISINFYLIYSLIIRFVPYVEMLFNILHSKTEVTARSRFVIANGCHCERDNSGYSSRKHDTEAFQPICCSELEV